MAVSIDYSGATYRIIVPQADLTFISGTLYELNTDSIRLELKALEAAETGIVFQDTHRHNTEVTIVGVTYSRLIEILNASNSSNTDVYEIFFSPDTQYTVRLAGSNNNFFDIENAILGNTTTQVISGNSAGLTSSPEIQFASFEDVVTVDVDNGSSGTSYPIGTKREPVNNITDALSIATSRGIDVIFFKTDYTFESGDDVSQYTLMGQSQSSITLTFNSGSVTAGTHFKELTVQGELVSPQSFHNCTFLNVTGGTVGAIGTMDVHDCLFDGTITLSASLEGEINLVDCVSGVPGSNTPIFDVNGANVDVLVRNYAGGMEIRNVTNANTDMSIDMNSGHVKLANTCTAGNIIVRGIAKLTDNSAGTTVVNETVTTVTVTSAVWDAATSDHTTAGTFGEHVGKKTLTVAKFLGLK